MDEPTPTQLWMQAAEDRFRAADARWRELEQKLDNNTAVTQEIRDILAAARGAFKAFNAVGAATVWFGKVVAAGAGVYAVFYALMHGGRPPGGN